MNQYEMSIVQYYTERFVFSPQPASDSFRNARVNAESPAAWGNDSLSDVQQSSSDCTPKHPRHVPETLKIRLTGSSYASCGQVLSRFDLSRVEAVSQSSLYPHATPLSP